MKEIVCSFNLFSLNQTIYLCSEENQTVVSVCRLTSVVDEMLKYGEDRNVSAFHLIGNDMMAQRMAEELKTKYVLKYGKANEIEVNVN